MMIPVAVKLLLHSNRLIKNPTCPRTKVWLRRHSWELGEYFIQDGIERSLTNAMHDFCDPSYLTLALFCILLLVALRRSK